MLAVAAGLAFAPLWRNEFVNWDDPTVLLDNPHLGHVGVVRWAFSTTTIGHFQPLAWLAWSSAKSLVGLAPAAFHGLSFVMHLANGILVYGLTLRLARDTSVASERPRVAALLAASIFLLHPTSVEAVAWASALPYGLSLFALLLSFLAYVHRRAWIATALYAVSLLARPTALGYPLILIVVDVYPLRRLREGQLRRLVVEKIPFVALAGAAAAAEWYARDVASLGEIGLVPRLTMAMTAPFVYAWRTVWPLHLSPLHALPIAPGADWPLLGIATAGVMTITALAWRLRDRWPVIGAASIAYLTLIAPVAGLTPTGLQTTADRYMYVPNVVAAVVIGCGVARMMTMRRARNAVIGATIAMLVAFAILTWRQIDYWKDSLSLWSRTADLDPQNDVATYNLAVALAAAGRDGEAIEWYERTLALVPDHDLARLNRARLQAADAERHADRLAAAGYRDQASDEYARALALDSTRSHALAAHGMLMMQRGQFGEAAAELRRAMEAGVRDGEIPNALAFALAETGQAAEAALVLKRAVANRPDDVNVKHNLARLLATTADDHVRDGPTALRLALEVCERTGNRDPRALDTLAAAQAAVGRLDLARETAARAAARARALGDLDTAAEIDAHARNYRR
jgi:protein O-mannosyl-transferase